MVLLRKNSKKKEEEKLVLHGEKILKVLRSWGTRDLTPMTITQNLRAIGMWALPLEGKELFNGRSGQPGDFALVLSLYDPYGYAQYAPIGVLIGARVEGTWSPLTNFRKQTSGNWFDYADDGSVPKTLSGMVTALRPYVGKLIAATMIFKYTDEQMLAKAPAVYSGVSTAHIDKGVWDAVLGKGGYVKEFTEKKKGVKDIFLMTPFKDPHYYGSFGFAAEGIFLDGFSK